MLSYLVNINGGYNDHKLKKIKKYIKKLNIFVVRVNNQNKIKSSAPCLYCTKIIKLLDFNKIIYSEDNGTFTECKSYLYNNIHMSVGYIYMKFLKHSNKGECFNEYKKKIKLTK